MKPSVIKPAAQVKPGQKRKSAGTHCSAVAAVKPLNAVPAPDAEPPCKRTQVKLWTVPQSTNSFVSYLYVLAYDYQSK